MKLIEGLFFLGVCAVAITAGTCAVRVLFHMAGWLLPLVCFCVVVVLLILAAMFSTEK